MRYQQFEKLILTTGVIAIGAILLNSYLYGEFEAKEAIALVLLLVVLFAGLHYGIKGGFVAFLASFFLYNLLYFPTTMQAGITEVYPLLLIKALTYGIVGIGGGLIFSQIKYVFAKSEQPSFVDNLTGLYAEEYLRNLFTNYKNLFERYKIPFSMVLIELEEKSPKAIPSKKYNQKLKEIATLIKRNVRNVDEVGRLKDNKFLLILPNTSKEGANVVKNRLEKYIESQYGKEENVKTVALGYPEEKNRFEEIFPENNLNNLS